MPATDTHAPPPPSPPGLVVLGASVRAWAASARRAGWLVRGADLFADRDLVAIAEAVAVPPEDYPEGLAAAAARFPPGPWCYCGALENAPDLVDALSVERPLAGCPGGVLRRVRSPRHLAEALRPAGIGSPETREDPLGLPTDGSWLVKPLRSAAGRGIAPWLGVAKPAATARDALSGARVWQARVAGVPVSASFIVDTGEARLVGTTEQLVGVRSWHASPFAYCGSLDVAPDRLADSLRAQWTAIGDVLRQAFGLVGAIGVDAMRSPEGRLVVLEVNPRPTASMELVDRRTGGALARDHLEACGWPSPAHAPDRGTGGTWAKAVLRAWGSLETSPRVTDVLDALSEAWTATDGLAALADLPRTGTDVPAGAPLLTLFAVGDGPEDARRRLALRAAAVETALARIASPRRA